MSAASQPIAPRQTLGLFDAVAMIVGLIVGAGIFGTPSIVAGAVGSERAPRRGLDRGRHLLHHRRALLRRARDGFPLRRRRVSLPPEGFRPIARVPLRMGADDGDRGGVDRRIRLSLRRLHVARHQSRRSFLRHLGRSRRRRAHHRELCRDPRRKSHAEFLHRSGSERARAHHRRRPDHRSGAGSRRAGGRRRGPALVFRRRHRIGDGVRAVHLRRLERRRLHLGRSARPRAQHGPRAPGIDRARHGALRAGQSGLPERSRLRRHVAVGRGRGGPAENGVGPRAARSSFRS